MTKEKSKEEQRLETVQAQFFDWRKNRKKRGHIPESLWDAATSLADSFSINELSKALRLNQRSLKDRIETIQNSPPEKPCQPTFIEFPQLNSPADSTEVSLELEKAGARMKVHVKGYIDVASLVQTFWRQQS